MSPRAPSSLALVVLLVGEVAPVAAALQCYKVKDTAQAAVYTADLTGLAPAAGCEIKVPGSLFCVDSTVMSASAPIPDRPGGDGGPVLCYKLKCPKPALGAPLSSLLWNDPLGVRQIEPGIPNLVCSTGTAFPLPAPPSTKWTTLIGRAWTLGAGEEGAKCRTIELQSDTYVTGFRAIAPAGTDWMLLTVSDSATQVGDYDCTLGTNTIGFPGIYAAGVGTNDLVLPAGVAVHLRAGQFLNLTLVVANQGAGTVTRTSGVQIQTGTGVDTAHEAEMTLAGTLNISIPHDGQVHTAQGGCNAPQDYQAFAFGPHMYASATHIQLVQTHAGTPTTLLDVPYMLDAQLVYPTTPVFVQQGDQLEVACSYLNLTGQTVTFGDTPPGEQCFLGIYHYPPIPGGTIFGCVN